VQWFGRCCWCATGQPPGLLLFFKIKTSAQPKVRSYLWLSRRNLLELRYCRDWRPVYFNQHQWDSFDVPVDCLSLRSTY
jgi:hypothetical protein